ncbi:MAG: IclR family transcriptional regulator [Pseudomonadales bacterium]
MNITTPPVNVVKSVARVLEVMELFAQRRKPLSGMQICSALNYPKSSTNAILKSLVALDYLTLNVDNLKYFPAVRISYLGDWVPSFLRGKSELTQLLESLHDATGETVTISRRNGFDMQLIRVTLGAFPISLQIDEGFMAPIFSTAVGTAYLSTIADKEIRTLYEQATISGIVHDTGISLDTVMKGASTARKYGYAIGYDRILADTGAVAAPLRIESHDEHFVIAVAGLSARIHRSEDAIIGIIKTIIREHIDSSN